MIFIFHNEIVRKLRFSNFKEYLVNAGLGGIVKQLKNLIKTRHIRNLIPMFKNVLQ